MALPRQDTPLLSAGKISVLEHDGTVEVTSTPGVGSCFTVLLPLAEAASAVVDQPSA